MRRILITGSRDWTESHIIYHALLHEAHGPMTVVHGAAPGADSIAAQWAEAITSAVPESHPADWNKYGKAAGPIRNQKMVDLGADICLAFPLRQSRGTLHCMRIAHEAGIPVKVYSPNQAHGWMEYTDWFSYDLATHPQL